MGKLIEVLRRLSILLTGVGGGGLSSAIVFDGYRNESYKEIISGIVFFGLTYVMHRIINWILLKDEKNAPSENQ